MAGETGSGSRKRRTRSKPDEDIPDVYDDMLVESVGVIPSQVRESGRALKKRVTGRLQGRPGGGDLGRDGSTPVYASKEQDIASGGSNQATARPALQTAYEDSDGSEDSDVDWEDVGLKQDAEADQSSDDRAKQAGLDLVLGAESSTSRRPAPRKRPLTRVERNTRLEVHKMHLLCLLVHVRMRNSWCNDEVVQVSSTALVLGWLTEMLPQESLRSLLTKRAASYLRPSKKLSQFQRSRSFMDGLEQASEIWKLNFKITARGLQRARWADDEQELKMVCAVKGNPRSKLGLRTDEPSIGCRMTSICLSRERISKSSQTRWKHQETSEHSCSVPSYAWLGSKRDWPARCRPCPFIRSLQRGERCRDQAAS